MVFNPKKNNDKHLRVGVVIPALNEEASIDLVITGLFSQLDCNGNSIVDEIIVADNGSEDNTAQLAFAAGAKVVYQPTRGYGHACIKAISALSCVDIIIFIDGDNAFYPEDLSQLLLPFTTGADLVLGSRTLGYAEKNSMTPQQLVGNRLAVFLIKLFWRHEYTDLGPFRAIRREVFDSLKMKELTYGWTVEMQIKAIVAEYHICEVAVKTRARLGQSKVSGTLKGSIGAGIGILSTIAKLWWRQGVLISSLNDNKTCL